MVQQEIINELKNVFSNGNITLFLGAGVSAGNGLPNWNELVCSLFFRYMTQEEWERIKPYPNYLRAVSEWYLKQSGEASDVIVRGLKTGWYSQEYETALWDTLYSSLQGSDSSEQSALLEVLRDLITDPRKKIRSVITYNYDSLLEQTIGRVNSFDSQPVYSSEGPAPGKFPIYHVHGFMPITNNPHKKAYGQIVLSEEDYNSIISNSNYWGNIVQMAALASTTNLMVGLSLTDRNLRRILDIISRQPFTTNNYIFLKKRPQPELSKEQVEDIHEEAMKITRQWKQNPYMKAEENRLEQIQQILEGVIYNHEQNQKRIFEQLKIKPIWYEHHDDVVAYLHFMRQNAP